MTKVERIRVLKALQTQMLAAETMLDGIASTVPDDKVAGHVAAACNSAGLLVTHLEAAIEASNKEETTC